jgi:hypothetical protein
MRESHEADFLRCRPMDSMAEPFVKQFTNQPASHALETMVRIEPGPFASLEAALAAVERHDRNGCRHNPGEDQR